MRRAPKSYDCPAVTATHCEMKPVPVMIMAPESGEPRASMPIQVETASFDTRDAACSHLVAVSGVSKLPPDRRFGDDAMSGSANNVLRRVMMILGRMVVSYCAAKASTMGERKCTGSLM